MKRALGILIRLFLGGLVLIGVGLVLAFAILHKEIPEPIEGIDADQVALKMLEKLDVNAWNNTRYVSWNFPGGHQYVWDKETNVVEVKWGENRVILQTKNPNNGVAWVDGQVNKSPELLGTAWAYFCNDSFWLGAPFKVMDPGTERSVVHQDGEGTSLMIKYNSGGTTPGDVYVWHLDSENMPYEYQMWVNVFPIGGVKASWTDWQELPTGAMVSTTKKLFNALPLDLNPIKAGNKLSDLGLSSDYFSAASSN